MEFRIKKLGEDSSDDSNDNPNVDEINNLASTGQDEPVIQPTGEKSKLQLRNMSGSSSGPKLQLREEHQYGSKSAADEALGGLKCKNCGAEIEPETIICVGCGFNLKSGKNLQTKVKKTKAPRKKGPAKLNSDKKKSSVFSLSNVIILLVLLGLGFQFFIRPALHKAREKAIAAKCKVHIKSILTTASMGGGKVAPQFFDCPKKTLYGFYKANKNSPDVHRMVACHYHEHGGYSDGSIKELNPKELNDIDEINVNAFSKLLNLNQKK